jgi:hypothetical protein
MLHGRGGTQPARAWPDTSAVRSVLREPKPPYDDEDEEETPAAPARRSERCRVCRGTGRIHLVRGGKDVGRARRCPACRGTGFVTGEPA